MSTVDLIFSKGLKKVSHCIIISYFFPLHCNRSYLVIVFGFGERTPKFEPPPSSRSAFPFHHFLLSFSLIFCFVFFFDGSLHRCGMHEGCDNYLILCWLRNYSIYALNISNIRTLSAILYFLYGIFGATDGMKVWRSIQKDLRKFSF